MSSSHGFGAFARELSRGYGRGIAQRQARYQNAELARRRQGQLELDALDYEYEAIPTQERAGANSAKQAIETGYQPQQSGPLMANANEGVPVMEQKRDYSGYSKWKADTLKAARKAGTLQQEQARLNEFEKGLVRNVLMEHRTGIDANDPLAMKNAVEQLSGIYPNLKGMVQSSSVNDAGQFVLAGNVVTRDDFYNALIALPEVQNIEDAFSQIEVRKQAAATSEARRKSMANYDQYLKDLLKFRADELRANAAHQQALLDQAAAALEAQGGPPAADMSGIADQVLGEYQQAVEDDTFDEQAGIIAAMQERLAENSKYLKGSPINSPEQFPGLVRGLTTQMQIASHLDANLYPNVAPNSIQLSHNDAIVLAGLLTQDKNAIDSLRFENVTLGGEYSGFVRMHMPSGSTYLLDPRNPILGYVATAEAARTPAAVPDPAPAQPGSQPYDAPFLPEEARQGLQRDPVIPLNEVAGLPDPNRPPAANTRGIPDWVYSGSRK